MQNITGFWPISLIGSIYKLIAKVLARRISKVMDKVIGKCQNALIGGKKILDVALIVNKEVDDFVHRKNERILCKLDMEKAYNHNNLSFLDYMLMRMGFGIKWHKWIKSYITSTLFAVMVNGGLSSFFKASRDIREGNPFIPFVIYRDHKGF